MEEKNEILNHLKVNLKKFIMVNNGKTKDEKYNDFFRDSKISLPIQITEKSVYDYLIDDHNRFCICGNENKFYSFNLGYQKFCSKSCLYNWRSNKMLGDLNTCHSISKEQRLAMNMKTSKSMKKAIHDGKFTPCVTNIWAKSRCTVKIVQESVEKIINCRSSWEAYFQILNPEAQYEKLRIPYTYNNELYNYLVDFIDFKNKKIYEIKPSALEDTEINKIKFNAALNWANTNNYEFIVITEDWFKHNYSESKILNQPDYLKLKRLLIQFL